MAILNTAPFWEIRKLLWPSEVASTYGWVLLNPRYSPRASQVALVVKNLPANAGDIRDVGSIPGLGRSPGGGHVNPLQYSCLENPMDRGAWQAAVPRVTKSRRWLKQLSMCMHSWFTVLCLFLLYSKVTQLSICIDIFFHILFHYRSSQHIEYSSLCCTGGSCLFILHIIICIF